MALAAAGMAGVVAAAAYEMWAGILGQAAGRSRVGPFAEGPDPEPSAKIFYFLKYSLPRAIGQALGKDPLCRGPG